MEGARSNHRAWLRASIRKGYGRTAGLGRRGAYALRSAESGPVAPTGGLLWRWTAGTATVTVVPANMGDLSAMVGTLMSQSGNAKPAAR